MLGTVDPVTRHIHLSEIRGICVVNPLMPGHLYALPSITTRPVVSSILFEDLAGQRLSPLGLAGRVRVIAEAYDLPAMPGPYPWRAMPVSPAEITWKLTTIAGRVLHRQLAVDFRVSLPPRAAFGAVYAPGTLQNFAAVLGTFRWGRPGRYLYDLTPLGLDTARLRDGLYRFVVAASDTGGQHAARGSALRSPCGATRSRRVVPRAAYRRPAIAVAPSGRPRARFAAPSPRS